jgi:hypothetical protein
MKRDKSDECGYCGKVHRTMKAEAKCVHNAFWKESK